MSNSLQQCLLKSQLFSLTSHQRNLMKILQKQMHLVEAYVTKRAKLSTKPQGSLVVSQQPDDGSTPAFSPESSEPRQTHSYNSDTQEKESHRSFAWAGLLRCAPVNNTKNLTVPRSSYLPSQDKKAPKHGDVQNKKASNCQTTSRPEHINFKMKGKTGQIQTTEGNIRYLSKLIQRGVMPLGSTLQLLLKVRQCYYCEKHLLTAQK